MANSRNRGFSLFELMIVLIAIGLTAGGVLAGRSLVKSAALKSLNQEVDTIRIAMNQFRTVYGAPPGDFSQATKFWGVANADPTTCYGMDKSAGTATCDGNGDGIIQDNTEMYLLWHHLVNAKLLEGTYTGATGISATSTHTYDHDVGKNSPASRFAPGTGFGVRYVSSYGTANAFSWFAGMYGHVMMYGREIAEDDNLPRAPALTSEEMRKIDDKFDDGAPAKGAIVSRAGVYDDYNDCTQKTATDTSNTAVTDIDAVYALGGASDADDAKDKKACQLIYRNILE